MRYFFKQYWSVLVAALLITNACSFNPGQQLPQVSQAIQPVEQTPLPTLATQPGTSEPSGAINTKLGEAIDAHIRENHPLFSGSVLVASQGQVQLSKGYLWSDWELETPNQRSTKFRISSITKPITALAILMLQERGLLDVHDPICQYVPACPQAWEKITIHQLLTHTSGIPDYTHLENALTEAVQPVEVKDLVARFKDQPLEFSPGEGYSYSNSGYVLLGYILEQVSRRPYSVFLEENIFGPLNMKDSGIDNNRAVLKDRAHGYTIEKNTVLNGSYLNMSNAYAAAGLYSTVDDLYKLDQALYTDQLVSQETKDEIFTPYVDAPDQGGQYGYGWVIGKTQGHAMESHEGRIYGFHSLIERFPEDGDAIIVLSNVESDDLERLRQGIENLLFAEK